ncbi:MAG: hypothetical protein Q8O89_04495 [Nanoarchaeota archaeon]|nr:hypothetical protein [Nanoarchaeota archaeon]
MVLESEVIYRLENIAKGLSALSQTTTQLKGVAYIGDDKRTKAIAQSALELANAIGIEIDNLKNIDIVDEAITREANEKLLALLREASLNLDK